MRNSDEMTNGKMHHTLIWPQFRMEQYRDEDHPEDAPHFIRRVVHIQTISHRMLHSASLPKNSTGQSPIFSLAVNLF